LARFRLRHKVMAENSETLIPKPFTPKPILLGLTCWRWQSGRVRALVELAERLGVKLQVTTRLRGLRREIECQVSGDNVDRFIGEFVRHG
jgi:hypothetical protein